MASVTSFTSLPPGGGYYSPVQQSALQPLQAQNYAGLAQMADRERQMNMQRAAGRQNAVIGGYDQQIANARLMGDRGYANLQANYDQLAADAAATRARNMARIDQYGNSMRQDLNIRNQQALAKASQSAIQRGLGNTTVMDSLVRGQNFDNTRQVMSLEDQLLQNRISTDSQLSGAYQSALGNRAQALNSQFNQNMATENQLTGNRLGYIGSIQDDTQGLQNVANLYDALWKMENANRQAELDRSMQYHPSQNPWKPVTGQKFFKG